MGLKTRHIMQNIKQIEILRHNALSQPYDVFAEKWDKTIDKVHWEKNSLVTRHPNISSDKILPKGSTSNFPADAVTVRYNNQARKIITAYFHGPMKTRSWGNGAHASTHSYPDGILRVTLPFSKNHFGYSSNYCFQGELPTNFDLESLKMALEYITMIIEEVK